MISIQQWCEDRGISEVEALMPDMAGVARGKIMPADKYLEDEGMNLPEALILQTITGDYPEDQRAVRPSDSDMILRADPDTIRAVPWANEPTAQVLHDAFYADGSPVEAAPRYVLRRVLELYEAEGWRPVVAPELEFYLVKPNTDPDYPLEPPVGRSGRAESGRQSYSIDAINEYDRLIEQVYSYCEAQRIQLDTLIHESGAAQMEINLIHGDPLDLADQAFLFKRTVREAALRNSMYATFMAKPMEQEPGSAMHIHQSVIDIETGANVFARPEGGESKLFMSHVAGLQRYLPAAMCILAPNVNSYRRITRFYAAPINLRWGHDNRTAGLRVPVSEPEATRVENRVAGADANPYLAIAASLACGYLGMKQDLTPSEPLTGSAYELPYELPLSLEESILRLRDCQPLIDALGERFVMAYTAVKESELRGYLQVISSWERQFLLLNV
ncbi:MAG: glutamine synthetase family protein [Gammaproteobacteria bacterium]|nr:glutamine synthetase family protein [Gammaproteobacteria bacterium]